MHDTSWKHLINRWINYLSIFSIECSKAKKIHHRVAHQHSDDRSEVSSVGRVMRRIRDQRDEPWHVVGMDGRGSWSISQLYTSVVYGPHDRGSFWIKDGVASDHPVISRLASASGQNDVRDFWSAIDVGVDPWQWLRCLFIMDSLESFFMM